MTARLALALPECSGCDRPTQRQAFEANGGLCTACLDQYGTAREARSARARRRRA